MAEKRLYSRSFWMASGNVLETLKVNLSFPKKRASVRVDEPLRLFAPDVWSE